MGVPPEYEGRQQTWLKHQVLKEYVRSWAQKLCSMARTREVRLWYVDCFAGPWQAAGEELQDTSVAIGIQALHEALENWREEDFRITAGAVFVEKDPKAYQRLSEFVTRSAGSLDAHVLHGEFGQHVAQIQKIIGEDFAFLFVDPTGWKGVAMDFIAPLARKQGRDTLINVMIGHMKRFKDDPRDFLRMQMRDFFGLREEDLPPGLSEEALITYYNERLTAACGAPFVADLIVPDPVEEKTKFRLVIASHHHEGLRLFRGVEGRVIGKEAAEVRSVAKEQDRKERRKGQGTLFEPEVPPIEARYDALRQEGLREVAVELPSLLRVTGPMKYADVWQKMLLRCHVSEPDLKDLVWQMKVDGVIELTGLRPRERSVKDEHVLRVPAALERGSP